HVDEVLHPDRDAVQRTPPPPGRELRVEFGGPGERAAGVQRDDRVERVVAEAVQGVADVLGHRELTGTERHPEVAQRRVHAPILSWGGTKGTTPPFSPPA